MFSLQMQNFRWFARSSPKTAIENAGWQFERLPSVMITTKPESQKEIAGTMTSLSRGDNGEFLEVSFQRSSPHFSATLPLESLAPGAPARTYLLDAMREMAGSAVSLLCRFATNRSRAFTHRILRAPDARRSARARLRGFSRRPLEAPKH